MRTADDYRRVYNAVKARPLPDDFEQQFRAKYRDAPRDEGRGLPYSPGNDNAVYFKKEGGRYVNLPMTVEDLFRAAKMLMKTEWVQKAVARAEAEGRFLEDEPETPELLPGEYADLNLAMEWWALENGFAPRDQKGRILGSAAMKLQGVALGVVFHLSTTTGFDLFEDAAGRYSSMQYFASPMLD